MAIPPPPSSGNPIVDALQFAEGWGRAIQSDTQQTRVLARSSAAAVCGLLVAFYASADWSRFCASLTADAGVNALALILLLVCRPVEIALSQNCDIDNTSSSSSPTSVLEQRFASSDVSESDDQSSESSSLINHHKSSSFLSNSYSSFRSSSRMMVGVHLPSQDPFVIFHCCVFAVAVIASVVADGAEALAEYNNDDGDGHDSHHLSRSSGALLPLWAFTLVSALERVMYCLAFMWLSVTYRVLALRISKNRDAVLTGSRFWSSSNHLQLLLPGSSYDPKSTFHVVSTVRSSYEAISNACENLSRKIAGLTLCVVALVVLQFVITIPGKWNEAAASHFVAAHSWPLLLLLQLALASADLVFVSKRLVESMSVMEGIVRDQMGRTAFHKLNGNNNSNSNHPLQRREELEVIAELLRTTTFRVQNFPARISLAWFQLTTEWALSFVLLFGCLGLMAAVLAHEPPDEGAE